MQKTNIRINRQTEFPKDLSIVKYPYEISGIRPDIWYPVTAGYPVDRISGKINIRNIPKKLLHILLNSHI